MTLRVCCPEGHEVAIAAEMLGRTAACPVCFSVFHVEQDIEAGRHAHKEEKKAHRSRDDDDDDDDDEEDEKPQVKKKPAAKDTKDAKEKKSSSKKEDKDSDKIIDEKLVKKKKPAAKKDDDAKDADEKSVKKKKPAAKKKDDDDEEEEEEEEDEIEWTPRKRQLNLCIIGQYLFIGAIGVMILFAVVFMVIMDYFVHGVAQLMNSPPPNFGPGNVPWGEFFVVLLAFVAAPFVVLAQILLLVGLGFSFAVPAKAEAHSLVISAVVFGVLFFLMALLGLLGHYEIVVEGEVRAANMVKLMGGVAFLCFTISLMSTMAFQAKLLGFMRLSLEASQAITNFGFYFLFFFITFILFVANAYICYYLHYLVGYIILLGVDALFAMAIRSVVSQIQLTLKLNRAIQAYIREA